MKRVNRPSHFWRRGAWDYLVVPVLLTGLLVGPGARSKVRSDDIDTPVDLEVQFIRQDHGEPVAEPASNKPSRAEATLVPVGTPLGGDFGLALKRPTPTSSATPSPHAPDLPDTDPSLAQLEYEPSPSFERDEIGMAGDIPVLTRRRKQEIDVDSLLAVADLEYARLSSLRANFVQRIDVPLLNRTKEGRGVWSQRGRGHFRMDFEDPQDDILIADGTCLWQFEPSVRPDQVISSALGDGTDVGSVDILGRLLSEARTNYDGVYMGMEDVAGVSTHLVSLAPKGSSRYLNVRVWIAGSDGLVRRFRIQEENETIRTVTLSNLEPEVPLADSLFRFTRPPAATIFSADKRCG